MSDNDFGFYDCDGDYCAITPESPHPDRSYAITVTQDGTRSVCYLGHDDARRLRDWLTERLGDGKTAAERWREIHEAIEPSPRRLAPRPSPAAEPEEDEPEETWSTLCARMVREAARLATHDTDAARTCLDVASFIQARHL